MAFSAEELGRRIRSARQAAGLTQSAVAAALGTSRPAVSQMESGSRGVSSLELRQLAGLCGRNMEDFFSDRFSADGVATALFRSHPDLAADADLRAALSAALEFGRAVAILEDQVGVDRHETVAPVYTASSPARKWDAIRQGEQVAEAERRRLGFGTEALPDLMDLLDRQGVRAVAATMPSTVSGLMLAGGEAGLVVAVNERHVYSRQRFSLAHEYAHVLFDRGLRASVSLRMERDSLREVRANSFAASFLLPAEGVRRFVRYLAKGRGSRDRRQVFDGADEQTGERRLPPGSQEIRLHDLALLAHHFGVSRTAALYRLKSLRLVDEEQRESLAREDGRDGSRTARLLGLRSPAVRYRRVAQKRLLALAIEAFRRETISWRKLCELARLVEVEEDALEELAARSGVGPQAPVRFSPATLRETEW